MTDGALRQKEHYEAIHEEYADHYYDEQSMAYRRRFYYEPAFVGLDLGGMKVADLASGSGFNSIELLRRFPDAVVTGFDISAKACADYRRLVGRPAHELDLTKPLVDDIWRGEFDVAMVWGGLHHCVSGLSTTLANIADMLRPGGVFIMLEPNADFVLNGVRRLWYRLDRYFDAATEAPLSHAAVHKKVASLFETDTLQYLGGPGYFLVAQSMILRLPKNVKRALSGVLTQADALYNAMPWSPLHPYFVARWRRTSVPVPAKPDRLAGR